MWGRDRRIAAIGLAGALAAATAAVGIGGAAPVGAAAKVKALNVVNVQTAFSSPTPVDQSVDASEPGVDVDPTTGYVYINAPAGLLSNLPGSPSYVWRSTDATGASFTLTPPGTRALFPGGGDSDIAIDQATGALYMTDLWLGSATVSSSTDHAQSWTANPLQGVVVQDRQWIATTGSKVVYHVTHQIPSGLIVSKSIDGGLTFPINNVAATPLDQTGCVCPPGNLIAAPGTGALGTGDKVGVIYATSTGGVNFAHSENGGLTFTNSAVQGPTNADTAGNFPVIADAGGGKLVAVWYQADSATGPTRIMYNTSPDWGTTWGAPATLVSGGTSVFPWVAANSGKVAVTLMHTGEVGLPDTVSSSAQWFEEYVDLSSGTPSAMQVVDTTPTKEGPICTEGINCTGGRELGDFQQDFVDNTGRVHITWARSTGSGTAHIMYAHT